MGGRAVPVGRARRDRLVVTQAPLVPPLRIGFRVRVRVVLTQDPVQQRLVDPRLVEGRTATPVREREQRGDPDVRPEHLVAALPCGVRDRRTRDDEVGPQPVHVEGCADLGDLGERGVGEPHGGKGRTGLEDPLGQGRFGSGEAADEAGRVDVVRHPSAHHLGAQRRLAGRGHVDGEPEPVQQLRAELALLGVHGADEHEPRGVAERDAVALDRGAALGGGVEQQVDEVVLQQVDLVDVEHAAVGSGEQPGLVLGDPVREHLAEVQ